LRLRSAAQDIDNSHLYDEPYAAIWFPNSLRYRDKIGPCSSQIKR
jgi:hypothetical protein